MTDEEKQELWNYIKQHINDTAREIQMFCGGSLSTIRKYKRLIKKRMEEEE